MQTSVTKYPNIDLVKLLMAFCVVAIHVSKLSSYTLPPVLDFTVRLAVPFFLVVSGFFLYPKLFDSSNKSRGKILLKYLKMYVVWTLVYLPFAVLYYYRADYTVMEAVKEYLYNFFVTGETPLAWHMWYMHTLIISVLFLWGLSYTRLGIEIFSLIVFCVAISFDVVIAFGIPFLPSLTPIIENGQNALMTGLPALCSGVLIKKYVKNFPPQSIIISVVITILCILLYTWKMHVYCVIFTGILFELAVYLPQVSRNTLQLRECSKYVYFLHLLVAFMLRGRFDSVFVYWLVVSLSTLLLAICLIYINNRITLYRTNKGIDMAE